jgi:hypothetical protein
MDEHIPSTREGTEPSAEGMQEPEVVDAPLGTEPASEERKWDQLDAVMERHLATLGLRVEISESKGRSLVATRLFRAGDIVIQQVTQTPCGNFPRHRNATCLLHQLLSFRIDNMGDSCAGGSGVGTDRL